MTLKGLIDAFADHEHPVSTTILEEPNVNSIPQSELDVVIQAINAHPEYLDTNSTLSD